MGVTGEIAILVKYSPKREQQLESIKLSYEEGEDSDGKTANNISKLSATRWTVCANSFQRVIDNCTILSDSWDVCLEESGLKDNIRRRIIGCKSKMESFDYYFGFKVSKMLYFHTDKLSQTLQDVKMSAVSSKRLAMLTVDTISSLRNDESFNALYDTCLKETEKIPTIGAPFLKRNRKYPKYSILHHVEGWQSKSQGHHPNSPRDHYRQEFYNAVDVLLSSVRDRFDQPSFLVFKKLESLLVKALKGEDFSCELEFVGAKYDANIDVEDLTVELSTLKLLLKGKSVAHFYDLVKEMKLLNDPERHLLSNVMKICKLLAVNPASSATGERTFSLARRVKTWMRSSMLPTRLNSVSVLNFHKERTDPLDSIKFANAFIQANDNRLRGFGKFTEAELD